MYCTVLKLFFIPVKCNFCMILQIDGSYSFVISKDRVTKLSPYTPYSDHYGSQLVLNASVTEKLTQKTYYSEATLKLYRSALALKYAESNPKAFKAGFPFQALVSFAFDCTALIGEKCAYISLTCARRFHNYFTSLFIV